MCATTRLSILRTGVIAVSDNIILRFLRMPDYSSFRGDKTRAPVPHAHSADIPVEEGPDSINVRTHILLLLLDKQCAATLLRQGGQPTSCQLVGTKAGAQTKPHNKQGGLTRCRCCGCTKRHLEGCGGRPWPPPRCRVPDDTEQGRRGALT